MNRLPANIALNEVPDLVSIDEVDPEQYDMPQEEQIQNESKEFLVTDVEQAMLKSNE